MLLFSDAKTGTFHGNAFLRHKLVNNCGSSATNRISFDLITVDANIVLFESVEAQNTANSVKVSLSTGRLRVEISEMDSGAPVSFGVESPNTINDERWHSVKVVIDTVLLITVDGITTNGGLIRPTPTCLPAELTLGAAADLAAGTFYTGCIRALHVNYEQPLELIYVSRSQSQRSPLVYENVYISTRCEPRIISCDSRSEGILLVDESSSVSIQEVNTMNKLDVRFSYSSQMPEFLLASAVGDSDYLYLTAHYGKMCLAVRGGSGQAASLCTNLTTLAQGELHKVHISKTNGFLSLTIDMRIQKSTWNESLSVGNELVFGHTKSPCVKNATSAPDPGFQLPTGFRGCLRNVTVNGFCAAWEQDFTCATGQVRGGVWFPQVTDCSGEGFVPSSKAYVVPQVRV